MFIAALPADAEHDRIKEEFDRHFSTANGHHIPFYEELSPKIQTNKQSNGFLTQHVIVVKSLLQEAHDVAPVAAAEGRFIYVTVDITNFEPTSLCYLANEVSGVADFRSNSTLQASLCALRQLSPWLLL